MMVARNITRLLWIQFVVAQCFLSGAQYSKTGKVSLEHLNNGLTYCLSHEEGSLDKIAIKLMVKFDQKWETERERILSFLLEGIVMESLEDNYLLQESKENIYFSEITMQEPQSYVVPNLILYHMDIDHPTQEVLDFTFAFLSLSLESLASIDLSKIETKLTALLSRYQETKQCILIDSEEVLETAGLLTSPITGEEVKRFCEQYYRPENMVLFVSGDLSKLAIVDSIKNFFSSLVAIQQEKSFRFGYETFDGPSLQKINYVPQEKNRWLSSPYKVEKPDYKSFDELPLLEKEEQTIEKIMHALASSNIPRLLWRQKELERMGKTINHVHPLRFISFIINEPILRSDLQEVHRNYFKWRGFLDGFRRRMTEEFYKGNLKDYIPGFCQHVDIKPEIIEHFIDKRDWEGLVKSILY